ncbi:Rieske 2Fe-2S domain-containing protein [Arenibacter palladensis]|uniref:Rieske 2Fe-2S domain-containing protein n=1 Tax=Arenibacter palladensis TaxID=237373 RepID=UPI0026E12364|nr:Rieske 2Fe-2S domain-containing protein [Arenibacter palladensis]MDO6603919.1 Rieske 2Fe-2S domain-containing protein [Arenibacter palladensis]
MERKEFLKSIGAGAALAVTFSCLGSCLREELDPNADEDASSGSNSSSTNSVPFTVDLSASEAGKLQNNGGYIIKNNIVIAKNLEGKYVAATVICSHEFKKKVVFKNNEFFCGEHDARFDQNGKGLNKNGSKGLKIYTTSINGSILTVSA